jgi:hypothetical protein
MFTCETKVSHINGAWYWKIMAIQTKTVSNISLFVNVLSNMLICLQENAYLV